MKNAVNTITVALRENVPINVSVDINTFKTSKNGSEKRLICN